MSFLDNDKDFDYDRESLMYKLSEYNKSELDITCYSENSKRNTKQLSDLPSGSINSNN